MTPITADRIEHLRNLNIQAYSADKQRLKADFGNERKFTLDYNGRQILELLQNADDAQTDAVRIVLNEDDCTLTIANNGIPFSAEGLDSLRLAGNSSKNKREFIGNKGLGFRSILSWVSRIRIFTRDYVIEFSPTIATREFELLISDTQLREKMIEEQEDLLPGSSPFPVLSYMDYSVNNNDLGWETIVELRYNRDILGDIIDQLDAITPEVLLFLNHTQRIEVIRNEEAIKKLERTVLWERPYEARLRVNDIEWNIYDSGECAFPEEEKKYYRYKVAWRDDLSDENAVFYNFFPTRVSSYLPCLIHATFELTVDRNQLIKHPHNDFVMGKIADTLGEIAESKLKGKVANWLAYRILYPAVRETDKWLSAFYSRLKILRETLKIYPSVDGNYYHRDKVVFYGNNFSHWIVQKRLGKYCDILLKNFLDSHYELKTHRWLVYTDTSILNIIGKLSDHISSMATRCQLIRFLTEDSFKNHRKLRFPLVLDVETNFPIESERMAFLIRQASVKDYHVPKYANLSFISSEFYRALLKEFDIEIRQQRIGNEDPSRPLKRILGQVLNLGSNDITDVIASITKAFSKKRIASIKQESIDRLYREYVGCLFRIFSTNQERRNSINETILLRNRLGETMRANELLLGKCFPSGNVNEELFSGVFTDADFLADIDFWKLGDNVPVTVLEEFFVWLGVNRRTRVRREIRSLGRSEKDGYVEFVFNAVGWPNYESHKRYEATSVSGIEQILTSESFSKERCLAWIIIDSTLHNLLRDDTTSETFTYTYNGIITSLQKKPSYFKYQLSQAGIFSNVVADKEVAKQLGLRWINLKHELFQRLGISETAILDTLRQLGAVLSFAQLSPDHIFKLLKDCGKPGGSPRKLYELALAYFRQRETEDFSAYLGDLKVWATRQGIRQFMSNKEVYYTDNTTLPEHMLSEYWIFDFPKKRGASQISKAFGINTFKSLKIALQGMPITHQSNALFQNWLEAIKPHLLTYRLNNLREDVALRREGTSLYEDGIGGTDSASQLNKLNILICASASYTVNDGSPKQLTSGEFIPLGDRSYCLCVDSVQSLEEWKQMPVFCEAFAEILCMLFDTQKNKEDFKAVFRDNADLRYTTYNIEAASLSPVLEEARSLLGLPQEEIAFWKAVFTSKQLVLPTNVTSKEALCEILLSKLQYDHTSTDDIDYINWSTDASYTLLKKLQEQTGITPAAIYDADKKFTGLKAWHYQRFHKISLSFEQLWIYGWWKLMSGKGDKMQRSFLAECQKYNEKAETASLTLSCKHEFDLHINHSDLFLTELSTASSLKLITKREKEIVKNNYANLLLATDLLPDELPLEIQSLLYFEGNDKIIEEAIKSVMARKMPTHAPASGSNKPPTPAPQSPIQFTSLGLVRLGTGVSVSNRPGRKPGTYSVEGDARKNAAGQRAEEIVYLGLKSIYPVVQWLSRYSTDLTINKDDWAGYDMRYKLDDKNESDWFYVEVKSSSEDSFIISRNEVEFALKNTKHYQLAIVQNGIINLDKHFFCDRERIENFTLLLSNPSIKPTHFEVAWGIK